MNCQICGNILPKGKTKYCSSKCSTDGRNKIRRENNAYKKKIGICPRCGNKSEPNKTLCYECIGKEQDRYYEKERNDDIRAKDREKKKMLKGQRLSCGLCPKCGKEQTIDNGLGKKCRAYLYKYRERNRHDINRSERVSYGYCYICGEQAIDGRGVCQKCYEKRLETLPSMWENMNNEYFKKLNDLHYAEHMEKVRKKKEWKEKNGFT